MSRAACGTLAAAKMKAAAGGAALRRSPRHPLDGMVTARSAMSVVAASSGPHTPDPPDPPGASRRRLSLSSLRTRLAGRAGLAGLSIPSRGNTRLPKKAIWAQFESSTPAKLSSLHRPCGQPRTVKIGALEIGVWRVGSSFLKREVKSQRVGSSFLKFRN